MARQITRIKHNKYIFDIRQDSISSVKQYHACIDHAPHLHAANDSSIEINTQFKCYDNKKYNC